MQDKYHKPILQFLEKNGESGVNAISAGIAVPLSTVQKYLEKQTYFKKTQRRKWDLPEKVVSNAVVNQSASSFANVANVISTQANMIRTQLDTALMCMGILESNVAIINHVAEAAIAPVAVSKPIHPSIQALNDNVETITQGIKKYINDVNENYRDLVRNADIYRIYVAKGGEYMHSQFNDELVLVLTKSDYEMSEEMQALMKEYAK